MYVMRWLGLQGGLQGGYQVGLQGGPQGVLHGVESFQMYSVRGNMGQEWSGVVSAKVWRVYVHDTSR